MLRRLSEDARYRNTFLSLAGLALAMLSTLAWFGRSYYPLPSELRVDHPDHAILRASGGLGHFYGMLGAALIVLNLAYFLRKKLRFLQGRGTLRGWLVVHIATGLAGPGFVLFHSAFRVRNEVAGLAAIALAVLVVSGALGRYFYGALPHRPTGEEQDEAEARQTLVMFRSKLAQEVGGDAEAAPLLAKLRSGFAEIAPMGPLQALLRIPAILAAKRRDDRLLRAVEAELAQKPRETSQLESLAKMCRDILNGERQVAIRVAFHDLFSWWRAFHRAFAMVVIATMIVHVSVAVYYGYSWLL